MPQPAESDFVSSPEVSGSEQRAPAEEVWQSFCRTLLAEPAGPQDRGARSGEEIGPTAPEFEQVRTLLNAPSRLSSPEVRVCQCWLSATPGAADLTALAELLAPGAPPLSEPVRTLVYRLLAYQGRRGTLAGLLPREGPLSFAQAEAMLEAAQPPPTPGWSDRFTPGNTNGLPGVVEERYRGLLEAEAALARGDAPEVIERTLTPWARWEEQAPPRDCTESESRRLAVRAAAALVRARLAQGRGDEGILAGVVGHLLPAWERNYLQGLVNWRLHNSDAARTSLEEALAHNPAQTSVRLALACILAPGSPAAALETLAHPEPTRELFVARAALLVRLGHYEEAEATLASSAGEAVSRMEPPRYSWARGREQSCRQEEILRAALAECRGDWSGASRTWLKACGRGCSRALQRTRQLLAARRELNTFAPGRSYRRSVLEAQITNGLFEIGDTPLQGDALFFRAATWSDDDRDRAIKDLRTLARQPGWWTAEQRVGGGRITALGDLLLRLGETDDALAVYERAGTAASIQVKERLAAVLVYAAVRRGSGKGTLAAAIARANQLAPSDPRPHIMGALGYLLLGETTAALTSAAAVEQRGAPAAMCRCLRIWCASTGNEVAAAPVTENDWAALGLSPKVDALLRLMGGTGPEAARLEAFVRAFGDDWTSYCPLDAAQGARRLVASWTAAGNREEALRFAEAAVRAGQTWATELLGLLRLGSALEAALRGRLEDAEREVLALERDAQC